MDKNRLAKRLNLLTRQFMARESTVMMTMAVVVGGLTGLGAVLLRRLLAVLVNVFFVDFGEGVLGFMGPYSIIVVPAVGGLIVGVLVHFFAHEAKGHGVPEVMEAMALRGGRIRPIVVVIKSLASGVCIGSGGSAGSEGPIVQIGAGLGSTIGQVLHLSDSRVRNLVACGAASGIAATFNTPIAGVFFALEVIIGDFGIRTFSTVVVASVMSTMVATGLLGNTVTFVVPEYSLESVGETPLYMLLGLLSAVVGILFIRGLHTTEQFFEHKVHLPGWLKPAVGGLLVGIIGFFVPQVFGVGYESISAALFSETAWQVLAVLIVVKIVATSLTLGSGGSGGVFAPALFMGAMLGGVFGHFVVEFWPGATAPAGAYALVGMAAVFSASARAPITAVIILFEMTRNYEIILPLMFAVAVSTIFASFLHKDSIYSIKLRSRGIDLDRRKDRGALTDITVAQAMKPVEKLTTVSPDLPLTDMARLFKDSFHHGFAVVDDHGDLFGIVTLDDLHKSLRTPSVEGKKVRDICARRIVTAYPEESIQDVLATFGALDVGRIPVVDSKHPKKLVGMLRWSDTVRSYSQVMLNLEYEAGTTLLRCDITATDAAAGKSLRELALPEDSVVNQIQRGKHLVVPRGDTIVQPGDTLVILASTGSDDVVCQALYQGACGRSVLPLQDSDQ